MVRRCVGAAALMLAVSAGRADQKAEEDAVVALAGARAKAELVMTYCRKATSDERSGWVGANGTLDATLNKCLILLDGAIEAEEKRGEAASKTFIENCKSVRDSMRLQWETWNGKERAAAVAANRDASEAGEKLREALEGLCATERAWKEAGLEPAVLQPAFEGIYKKAQTVTAAAKAALEVITEKQKSLDLDLKEVEKLIEIPNEKK